MKRILLPLTLGLLLTLTACGPTVDKPTNSATTPPTATATASPSPTAPQPTALTPVEPPVWEDFGGSCSFTDTEDGLTLIEGNYRVPRIKNASGVAAYTAINTWYDTLLTDLKNDALAQAGQAQDDYATSKALGDAFSSYSSEQTYEIMYQTDALASVLRTYYGYTSSPYPTLMYMADRFDMTTGAFLKFGDFFTDSAKAEEIIRAEVVRQGAEHADYDQAAIASAFNTDYFYPTTEGFVFYYQPQILNPQAATKPEFLVPYSLLEGLLSR